MIVAGDTMLLPWLITHEQRHAPHWFLIDAVNESEHTVHITNQFKILDEKGEQRAFDGWLSFKDLALVARADTEPNPVLEHRDRWAFGEEFDPEQSVLGGSQWFEAVTPCVAYPVSSAQCLDLLQSTQTGHGQSLRPASLTDPAWICGLNYLRRLPEYFAANLSDPDLYKISDDLWVAARSRQLFAGTLVRFGGELGLDGLIQVGAFCEAEVVAQWLALPRIMRYNASCLERGRPPRALAPPQVAIHPADFDRRSPAHPCNVRESLLVRIPRFPPRRSPHRANIAWAARIASSRDGRQIRAQAQAELDAPSRIRAAEQRYAPQGCQ